MRYDMLNDPRYRQLNVTEQLVLHLINWFDGNGEGCWRSAPTLADNMNVHVSTVRRALATLTRLELITTRHEGTRVYRAINTATPSVSATPSTSDRVPLAPVLPTPSTGATPPLAPVLPKENYKKTNKRTVSKLYTPEFDLFWSSYPKRQGKQDAAKVFASLSADEQRDAIAGANRYATSRSGQDPTYTKLAGGWLRDRRWEDEDTVVKSIHEKIAEEMRNDSDGEPRDIRRADEGMRLEDQRAVQLIPNATPSSDRRAATQADQSNGRGAEQPRAKHVAQLIQGSARRM